MRIYITSIIKRFHKQHKQVGRFGTQEKHFHAGNQAGSQSSLNYIEQPHTHTHTHTHIHTQTHIQQNSAYSDIRHLGLHVNSENHVRGPQQLAVLQRCTWPLPLSYDSLYRQRTFKPLVVLN